MPLAPIANRPLIAMALDMLARAGSGAVRLLLCHDAAPIADYVDEGRRWGLSVRPVHLPAPLGDVGTLRFAAAGLEDTLLVLPGDAILDLEIEEALAFHRAHGGLATAIVRLAPPRPDDDLLCVDRNGGVTAASSAAGVVTHTGAYVLEPAVLDVLAASGSGDPGLIQALLAAGVPLVVYPLRGYWNPLRTLNDLHEAQQVVLYSAFAGAQPGQAPAARVRFPALEGRQIAPGVWAGDHHAVHPSARLVAPLCIGAGAWVARAAELGPGVVCGPRTLVDTGAVIRYSTIVGQTYIGRQVQIESRIVSGEMVAHPATGEIIRVEHPRVIGRVGAAQSLRLLRQQPAEREPG